LVTSQVRETEPVTSDTNDLTKVNISYTSEYMSELTGSFLLLSQAY